MNNRIWIVLILSFFLVACDYTLIGEELFAASGLVSADASASIGVLAQDWLKYAILAILITGVLLGVGLNIDIGHLLSP